MSALRVDRPDVELELAYLKDFQRLSVDTVFRRMYLDEYPTRRFLIADEVGLGKTLVARGVIARTIEHLWDNVERIDIIYLCSNSDIARQNVRRLTPHQIEGVSLASRITLLPLTTHNFNTRKVNVVALTPGTSLSLKGNLGIKQERALLYHILVPRWGLDRTGAARLFAGNAALKPFKRYLRRFAICETIDEALRQAFIDSLDSTCTESTRNGKETIRARLESLVYDFRHEARQSRDLLASRTRMIGELRQILARSCISALQPDLIILDEFQRFKELLDGEGPAGEMAKHLFEYEDLSTKTRVLLLSATPYKMYTVQDEAGNEDHYADFLRTLRFLFADNLDKPAQVADLLQQFRRELFKVGHGEPTNLRLIRDAIESSLREVMVRTERLAVTPDRSGMLAEKHVGQIELLARDARGYTSVQALARLSDSPDTMEYWKAAPWLLNFMDDYKLRRDIDELISESRQSKKFVTLVSSSREAFLPFDDVAAFGRLDPPHGKLRWLIDHTLGGEQWKLLWLPPTIPYYRLGEPFAAPSEAGLTKTLLFSAWRVVPRVIAASLSHEAERRMYLALEGEDSDLRDAPQRLGDLLQVTRKDGRAAGLTVLTLMYPCTWLANECDPMRQAAEYAEKHGRDPTLTELLELAEGHIQAALANIIPHKSERSTPDESWYWAAPILLDNAYGQAQSDWIGGDLAPLWAGGGHFDADNVEETGDGDEVSVDFEDDEAKHSVFDDLLRRVRHVAAGNRPGGTPPKDLLRTLALAAIASPAVVSLRAFSRIAGHSTIAAPAARNAAARVGAGFRTLFNQPDSSAIIRATMSRGEDYWKQCLEYSAAGCLQSVMDEYVHLLVGEAGVFGTNSDDMIKAVSEYVVGAVGLRRARVGAHDISVVRGKVTTVPAVFRSRFAMRFGEERTDEMGEKVRADEVRRAFNSPFWPFVLATTSVGQEGLDFHYYCHRVVHWNLPPNPVDLEQREGRVHRFKGHAVRRNLASRHPRAWRDLEFGDPWEATFAEAIRGRQADENDLVPYWVYPVPGGAAIERYVPMYPLSRDVDRFRSLRESLAIYRMVFGQPRQEELLSYLARVVLPDMIPVLQDELRISLAPRAEITPLRSS